MAETRLLAAPVLGGITIALGENRIIERSDLALLSVATRLGEEALLVESIQASWQLSMPDSKRSLASGDMRAIRTAPDQLLLVFPHETPDASRVVAEKLSGSGYVTDQTDAWVVLEVSGATTLAALERICPLDLDPSAFPINASARTVFEHMGAMIVRLSEDRFLLLSARSSAISFLHSIEISFGFVSDVGAS